MMVTPCEIMTTIMMMMMMVIDSLMLFLSAVDKGAHAHFIEDH